VRRELMLMAHASAETYVTAEKIVDYNLMGDLKTKAGTIPGLYVSAIAEAENGAWPLGIPDGYGADHPHLAKYAADARSDQGFQRYMEQFVFGSAAQAAE
jgi:glutaconate CoA-transferase subunit A